MPVARRIALLAAGQRGVVALHVLNVDHADVAEIAVAHHGARLPDERKAGVVEGLAEDEAGRPDALHQVERVVELRRQRLVGDDVETGIEGGNGERIVAVVRGHDRDHFHAVGAGSLPGKHLVGRAVGAVGGDAERHALLPRLVGAGGKHRGDDLEIVVKARGRAMDRPDEGARAAADDAEAKPPAEFRDGLVHWPSGEASSEGSE